MAILEQPLMCARERCGLRPRCGAAGALLGVLLLFGWLPAQAEVIEPPPLSPPASAPLAARPESVGSSAAAEPVTDPAMLERSRHLADTFMGELQAALGEAVAKAGLVGAVAVCRERAPAIAERLSRASGALVSRQARRNRNPDAAPDAVTLGLLPAFEAEPLVAPGRPREQLVAYTGPTGRHLRYLRAIPTGPMCLGCHGTQIDPAVQAAIGTHYPQDRATGFAEGDLRGVFAIDWPAVAAHPEQPE
ncbi:MAG TPA: hypothetical protein DCY89_00120 [Gammaproteobacteria bacterium]|nr:hypothetical protein [Gammaproteobacteria bacterium]